MIRRRNSRFSIMVAGPKGSGKSTFLNSLIGRPIINAKGGTEIDLYLLNIECNEVPQKVALIETPGFGFSMNDEHLQESIVDYIKEQFDTFIEEESKIRRNLKYEDTRVHCLIYLIPSTSNGMKPSDIEFLKKASGFINIVPVISKCDGLTLEEKNDLMNKVAHQIKKNNISVFDFQNQEFPVSISNMGLNEKIPFMFIGDSNSYAISHSQKSSGDSLNLENPDFSNNFLLREIFLNTFVDILIDITSNDLYEQYRTHALEIAMNE